MKSLRTTSPAGPLAIAVGLPASATAQTVSLVDILPSFAGVGVGVAPDYAGSDDYVAGLGPGGFYKFGGERYISWMGVVGEINLLDSPSWSLGMTGIRRRLCDVGGPYLGVRLQF